MMLHFDNNVFLSAAMSNLLGLKNKGFVVEAVIAMTHHALTCSLFPRVGTANLHTACRHLQQQLYYTYKYDSRVPFWCHDAFWMYHTRLLCTICQLFLQQHTNG